MLPDLLIGSTLLITKFKGVFNRDPSFYRNVSVNYLKKHFKSESLYEQGYWIKIHNNIIFFQK